MKRFFKPLTWIIVALLGAGSAALVIPRLTSGDDTYDVTAYFTKAIGLFENSDVMILGVPVGKVIDIEPEGERVRVDMEISDEYKIPADATAKIVPISVISDRYVQFSPTYDGGAALEDGDVLDVDRTFIPAELDDVFKQLKKLLDALEPGAEGEPGALGELIVQLDDTLRDREEDLQGTLSGAAKLTKTLAGAEENISGLLINLDQLFGTLATRAGSFGSLNQNFATVMQTLAESRRDLEKALENLGYMTLEVGDLVRDHRTRLGQDLRLASRITSAVIENRGSVEESLSWLPVVGIGLSNAYHGGEVQAVDVRDNFNAKFCKDPPEGLPPLLTDIIQELLNELCGATQAESSTAAPASSPTVAPGEALNPCEVGVRKVRRQLRRLKAADLDADVEGELIEPLEKRIRRLAKRCEELAQILENENLLEDLLDELPDVGDLPVLQEDEVQDLPDLKGTAAGATVAASEPGRDSWISGFLSFMGWSR